jgi:hypothetical protein
LDIINGEKLGIEITTRHNSNKKPHKIFASLTLTAREKVSQTKKKKKLFISCQKVYMFHRRKIKLNPVGILKKRVTGDKKNDMEKLFTKTVITKNFSR